MEQVGLDLVLHATRTRSLHRAAVRGGGDTAGTAHDAELVRILDETHVIEQYAHIVQPLGCGDAGASTCAHGIEPAHHARVPLRFHADRVVKRWLVLEELRHPLVELIDRMRLLEAEALACRLGAVAEAVPGLALCVALTAEKQRLAAD